MPKENYMKICSENEKWDNIIANFCFSLWEKCEWRNVDMHKRYKVTAL